MNHEKKFKNEFRTDSIRMQTWDYGKNAAYHVTICTKNKVHLFGQVVDENMQLNEWGVLVEKFWLEIPAHFSFVKLDEFVVMPNHVHGIRCPWWPPAACWGWRASHRRSRSLRRTR